MPQPTERDSDPSSTFERSCEHWSEQGRAEMEAFYRLATVDYQLLAEQLHWGQVFQDLAGRFGNPVRLLDVACGSGQFPRALVAHGELEACADLRVDYALLDPTEFSIREARAQLAGPFQPGAEHLCTIQQLAPPTIKFPILWATHAFYCVPPAEVPLALDRMLAALDPDGLGFVAHASRDAHYLRFHDRYLKQRSPGTAEPFCTGEQLLECLRTRVPRTSLASWTIDYEGSLDLDDHHTAELYLQRCLFDDTIDLPTMLDDRHLGEYLRSCMDHSAGIWRFPQKVWLIFFGGSADRIADYRRAAADLLA